MNETVMTWPAEVDFALSAQLERSISDYFARDLEGDTLVLDLGEVTFIDSTGLGVLIAARNRAAEADAALLLRSVSDGIRRVLSTAGLVDLFTYEDAGTTPQR